MAKPPLKLSEPSPTWQDKLISCLSQGKDAAALYLPPEKQSDLTDEVVSHLRFVVPEASTSWSGCYEVLLAYADRWAMPSLSNFSTLHMGKDAAASVLALHRLLVEQRQPLQKKWRWRGVAENPHQEAPTDELPRAWPELENALYCYFQGNWFKTEDDGGRLIRGKTWQNRQFWHWLGLGRPAEELAARLPHLAFTSPPPGGEAAPDLGALASFVGAIAVLRAGGCLVQSLQHGSNSRLETLAALSAGLFEQAEIFAPRCPSLQKTYLVALGFRGLQPGLLQALTSTVSKELSGKQSPLVLDSWASQADPLLLARFAEWLRQPLPQNLTATTYVHYLRLQNFNAESHLLWSHCSEQLLESMEANQPAVEPEVLQSSSSPRELLQHEEMSSTAAQDLELVLESRRRRWLHPDSSAPQAKRLRASVESTDLKDPNSILIPAAAWLQLEKRNHSHRALLQYLSVPPEAAVKTATGSWWRDGMLPEPWQFQHSAFVPSRKLQTLILARLAAGNLVAETGEVGSANALSRLWPGWCKRRADKPLQEEQLPPFLVAFVQLVSAWLPGRRLDAEGRPSLTYKCCLHVDGSRARKSSVAAWLSTQMGLQAESLPSSEDILDDLADTGQSKWHCYDLVLAELGHSASHEPAALEFDHSWRKSCVSAMLIALKSLAPGGDLFIQLPSLYSRFLAGVVVLLATAFSRVAMAKPGVVPPSRGDRWIVCNGFATVSGSATSRGFESVAALLEALRSRMENLPTGKTVVQVLPPSLLCTSFPGGIRRYLTSANELAMEAELEFWQAQHQKADEGCSMRQMTQLGIKRYLFAGPAHRIVVGLYFGTFDPFHENHFRLVMCALRSCGVRKVLLIPNQGSNPYKPRCASLADRCQTLEDRLQAAQASGELQPGEVEVRVEAGANNWPQREQVAQAVEQEECADVAATATAVLLLGEDSLLKSLEQGVGKHKNTGIFQTQSKPRRLIVFPRGGNADSILNRVPEKLKSRVEVAPYKDLVEGLSSTRMRELLESGETAPPDSLHPVVWARLAQAHRGSQVPGLAHDVEGISRETSPLSSADVAADNEFNIAAGTAEIGAGHAAPLDPRLHYSNRASQSQETRLQSPTVRLRNFNSFAKAILLEQYLSYVKRNAGGDVPISVLDIGCGKGGDLKKFANCGVTEYCGADVSRRSLEVLISRVKDLRQNAERARHGLLASGMPLREVSVIHADCWKEDLQKVLDLQARHATARLGALKQTWFHLISSQMACHYAFESQESAETLLRNVSARLCNGGYFVGTVPDGTRIVAAQRKALELGSRPQLGNQLYSIEFEAQEWAKVVAAPELWEKHTSTEVVDSKVFGVNYNFSLVDAVDTCREPLVHFGSLVTLARKYGLSLCMGPQPLAELVSQAFDSAKAELGRLRRIYAFEGGMRLDEAADQREATQFYIAFAFSKDPVSCQMSCEELAGSLNELHNQEAEQCKLPSTSSDIVTPA